MLRPGWGCGRWRMVWWCIRADSDRFVVPAVGHPVQQEQGFIDMDVLLFVETGEYGVPRDERCGNGWVRGVFWGEEHQPKAGLVLVKGGDIDVKVSCHRIHDRCARPCGRVCDVCV